MANSTTSMPRWSEPAASGTVFPCSWLMRRATSSRFASSSSRNRARIRARRKGGVSRQAGNAARAAATASPTSAALAKGARRTTAPVEGSKTSPAPAAAALGHPCHRSRGGGRGRSWTGILCKAPEEIHCAAHQSGHESSEALSCPRDRHRQTHPARLPPRRPRLAPRADLRRFTRGRRGDRRRAAGARARRTRRSWPGIHESIAAALEDTRGPRTDPEAQVDRISKRLQTRRSRVKPAPVHAGRLGGDDLAEPRHRDGARVDAGHARVRQGRGHARRPASGRSARAW